jgi:nucleoside-diphosphate-sugar epimerase
MIKIAVTGASGFIGKHVLEALSHRDVEVIAVSHSKTDGLPVYPNCRWVNLDIAAKGHDHYSLLQQPDVLIHLAWQGLPNYLSQHHFETELPVQFAFLKQLITQGLRSVVITGTCFEYGMKSGPIPADTETLPSNPYGFAKDALRKQLLFLRSSITFNLVWARLFYMFGEGQPETSIYPQLKKAVAQELTEFNMSRGEQLRDYLPVTEVAERLVAYACDQQHTGAVNICSGKPVSVRAMVETWILENEWDIKLNLGYYGYPSYEPMAFWGV